MILIIGDMRPIIMWLFPRMILTMWL
jgi:hypothetical protein